MNDVFYKEKLIWEHKIRNFEKEFLSIFPDFKLPTYKINFIDTRNTPNVKYSMRVQHTKSPMTLDVNMGFMINKNFDYKAILSHEFTHMHDFNTLLKDKESQYRSKALHLYSEYHATYIQGIYISQQAQNMQNVDIIENQIHENELYIKESIEHFSQSHKIDDWADILYGYMYYFGYINCYNYLTNSKHQMTHFNFKNDTHMYTLYNFISMKIFEESFWELCYKTQSYLDADVKLMLIADPLKSQ